MIALLPRDQLVPLLTGLSGKLEVVAPIMVEGEPVFSTWKGQNLALQENPLSPPLEFLLPQREVLFRYIQFSGRYTFEEIPPKPRLILGIRPCDLKAISILDRIFGSEPKDHPYFSRRTSTVLVALNCIQPGEDCFCAHLGSGPECGEQSDLTLTELESGYLAETGSPAGMLIMKEYSELFHKADSSHLSDKRRLLKNAKEKIEAKSDRSLSQIQEAIRKADWQALGRQCFSCGGCTFVCPVCHCFNIIDLGLPDGDRIRCRDSCIFSGFSRLAGGINPRKRQSERIQNWYLDKFKYIPEKINLIGCVGCGRCNRACLAEIDRWKLEVTR